MILTAKYTDQGGRELNEDSHGIFVKNGCICAVVADGFWEFVLEEEMEETLQNSKNPVQRVEQMVAILKKRVSENNDNNTAVAVWIINESGEKV